MILMGSCGDLGFRLGFGLGAESLGAGNGVGGAEFGGGSQQFAEARHHFL